MKRWLDGQEALGTVWLLNKMKSTVVNVNWQEVKDAVSIEVARSRTTLKAVFQEDKPIIHVFIQEDGNVNETKVPIDLTQYEEIKKLEQLWKEETRRIVLDAIRVAQKEHSDIFGFGEAVNRANPQKWKKLKKSWEEIFATVPVVISVEAFIRQPGMITSPHIPKDQKK